MYIVDQEINLMSFLAQKPNGSCGATTFFVGRVRNHHEGRIVSKLFYDCYGPMADKQIDSIVKNAKKDFGVEEIRVCHRIGWLQVGEVAVAISVSSPHRQTAFSACRAIIEEIKKAVPIWKKEVYEDGTGEWVLPCTLEEADVQIDSRS